MEITDKDAKRVVLLLLFIALVVLTFLIVRPVIFSIFTGLILAYIFFPVYKLVKKVVKWEGLAAAIVSIIVLLIILIPLWFLVPVIIQQIFGVFQSTQEINVQGFLSQILPTASEQVISQVDLTIKNSISKITSSVLNSLVEILSNFAALLLQAVIVAFVFFFALKDEAKFREFALQISPLNKNQEKGLGPQFKNTTNSIINGHVVAGIIQGILAGLGFLIFGVPNAVLLTILAIVLGIAPLIGPGLIYVPASIYLIITGHPTSALIFLLYNILIVSTVDNLFRIYFVSRKTDLSQVMILIGMLGGLLVFGILGLIIGPLVLGYFITLLEAYKNKTLSSFFSTD